MANGVLFLRDAFQMLEAQVDWEPLAMAAHDLVGGDVTASGEMFLKTQR